MNATYYKIGNYELGAVSTGKRSSNYYCWCEIYNENKEEINHFLSDRYTGKWPKCQNIINKWRKLCDKNKLTPLTTPKTITNELR